MRRSVRVGGLTLVACATLIGCSSQTGSRSEKAASYQLDAAAAEEVGRTVARTATSLIGSPYRYGGAGPRAFDCSGLVFFSYRAAGFGIPRTSQQQFSAAMPVTIEEARPGDLLFFRYGRKVSHVGIYLGERKFVHAPSTGDHVSIASLQETHYSEKFVGAGRLRVSNR
ncbi:MAG: C40 family peptidase [Gammaproteobacteria bacterium]|nr:C40 family peptidase [Gammaproteobacteria bacterium]